MTDFATWTAAALYRLGIRHARIASVGCGDNAEAKTLSSCGPVVGFESGLGLIALAHAFDRLPVVLSHLQAEALRGFDVAVVGLHRLEAPWRWVAALHDDVRHLSIQEGGDTQAHEAIRTRLLSMGWNIAEQETDGHELRVLAARDT